MRSASLKFKPVSGSDRSRDSEAGPAPSKLATSLTLAAMSLGYGVVQLDVTIVNTALNAIGTSLGGGVAELQWVVGAYTIAFAAFILTAGALGDRIGSKRIFIAGFALFTAASVACALAPNAATLISARCVQGLAAAILVPNSLALLSHAYTDEKARGRAVGIWAAGASLALTAGPFVGRRPDHAGRLALDLPGQSADRPCGAMAGVALCRRDDAISAARDRLAGSGHRGRGARFSRRRNYRGLARSDGAVRSSSRALRRLRSLRCCLSGGKRVRRNPCCRCGCSGTGCSH
jgi:hypothetical protein